MQVALIALPAMWRAPDCIMQVLCVPTVRSNVGPPPFVSCDLFINVRFAHPADACGGTPTRGFSNLWRIDAGSDRLD